MEWDLVRQKVLLEDSVVNLNCGSFGPTWRSAFLHAANLRSVLASAPMDFFLRLVPGELERARRSLADWVNHPWRRLFFTSNVSVAINLVAKSLLTSGFRGAVLLTDLEYGCMRWCWESLCAISGAELRVVELPRFPKDSEEIIDAFREKMTSSVKIVFFSHIISATGMILPAREICSLARNRGIVSVVDGAHGPGFLPLDIASIGANAYCANLHKWLGVPAGSAMVAFDEGLMDRLDPLVVSWGYRGYCNQPAGWDSRPLDSPDEWGGTPRLRRLEFQGTQDICQWLSTEATLQEWDSIGPDNVFSRQRKLSDYSRQEMAGKGWKAWTPESPEMHGAMTAWELPRTWNLDLVRNWLRQKYRLEVGLNRLPTGELLLRISNHFFTTQSEIDVLIRALSAPRAGLETEMWEFQ